MADTIFDKIARKEAPAFIIAENDHYMAFLDIFPAQKAQTVVIPKKRTTSKFSQADTYVLKGLTEFAQQVAKQIESKMSEVHRVQVVIEGFEVDYLHIKLVPAIFLPQDGVHKGSETQADMEELKKIQEKLVN